jgi:eukaryotic-like serine/threonine-protein kinase
MKHLFCIIALISLLPVISCRKSKPGAITLPIPSGNKSITSFVFKASDNAVLTTDVAAVISADSVVITLPYGTGITALKPSIQHNGISVTPVSGAVQNFSSPVTYTVKAEDGSTKSYLAVVKIHIKSTVYAGSADGKLYAFDGDNGTVKWTYTTAGTIAEACPAYYNGTVYVGSTDGFIHAVDAVTGVLKWKYSTGSNLGGTTPAINAGILYFGTATTGLPQYLRAVNATTGVKLWERIHPSALVRPTWYNAVVYACGLYGMDGFNASDGTPGIHFSSSIVAGNPLVVNNTVYNGTEATIVSAYNVTTGVQKWFYPGVSLFSPTLYKGTIYNTGSATSGALSYLYALDSATGALKWKFTAGINSYSLCSPVAANDIIYTVNANGRFYAVDAATGTQRWMFDDGIAGTTMPYYNCTVKGDMVYFGNHTKKFYALNALTGALIWQYTTGGVISGGACIVAEDGSVYHSGISGEQQ